MIFSLVGHDSKYELEKVARLFMPFANFQFTQEGSPADEIYTACERGEKGIRCVASVHFEGGPILREELVTDTASPDLAKLCELAMARCLFDALSTYTAYRPEWGIVTGIRPVRLLEHYLDRYGEKAGEMLRKEMLVSSEKLDLTAACLEKETAVIRKSEPNDFSLYISVPFCPSRCNYCSFVSHSVEKAKKLIPDYVEKLCEELRYTAQIVKNEGLRLHTIYIGGGTPTTLSAEQLRTVMQTVKDHFDLSALTEYTVEAGRPDTVTEEKLRTVKELGATRVSINPQTMNDSVLQAVGRRHTAAQTVEAYRLAQKVGFDAINMDLIAGLTSDTPESFRQTVDTVLQLDPDNVTVHTLSMKRASNLTKAGMFFDLQTAKPVAEMLHYAARQLTKAGIVPYYMYRQGKTVGNLENVGYAKEGKEGLYNIYIMDETHTILACGASAVTKLRAPHGAQIERIFNYKYPYEYLLHFDEMIGRKTAIADFYHRYPI